MHAKVWPRTISKWGREEMPMGDMVDYRKNAEKCYERARQMAKQEDLWAFLEMAQTWEKLASLHELSQRLKSSGVLLEKPVLRAE